MNILFFLTPKNEVAYVENDDTLRQVLEKIEYHKYTAIPMLNKNGKYVGTVTEGDLLRYIKEKWFLNIREAEDCSISRVPLRWKYQTVDINCNMEDLVDTTTLTFRFADIEEQLHNSCNWLFDFGKDNIRISGAPEGVTT